MLRIFFQILSFTLLFLTLFSIARITMGIAFIPSEIVESNRTDIYKMLGLGAVTDLRLIAAAFLPLLLCALLASFFPFLNAYNLFHKNLEKLNNFYKVFSSLYIGLFSFICIIFCFINFYYYQMYQSNITRFIFGLKDDETSTIIKIIIKEYPVFLLVFIALVFSIFCVFLNTKLLTIAPPPSENKPLKFPTLLILFLIFSSLYTLALRGPFRHITMNVDNYHFSSIEALNAISLNPLMAFAWAHKNYKKESLGILAPVDERLVESFLPHFPLFVKTPQNPLVREQKPHIMVNLMESFGSNLLAFHNDDLDLLGSLQPHIKQDFFWERFLPYENWTAPSFSFLYFGIPIHLSKSNYNKHYLAHSPIETYKKQGYKVIFLTSGNRSWYALGDFMLTQGADSIIDEIVLRKRYLESAKTSNSYGVLDEFMYDTAFEILKDSTQPLLILALTTSNHPPYPNVKITINENAIPQELHNRINKNKIALLNTYAYANDAFGKFLNSIKQSPLKDRVIIAATGDHRVRDITSNASKEKALSFGVPFYLYLPKNYQHNISYNPNHIGSHKDIFPTLFAFSLDSVEYLNLGGKNLLSKDNRENFGYNASISIDNNGIYPKGTKQGYGFANAHNLLDNNMPFTSNKNEFITLYEKYLDYQFRYRLINLQNNTKN